MAGLVPNKATLRRLADNARAAGFPVDRMGLIVEAGRITLLPPANLNVSDEDAALDAELEAIDARGRRGR